MSVFPFEEDTSCSSIDTFAAFPYAIDDLALAFNRKGMKECLNELPPNRLVRTGGYVAPSTYNPLSDNRVLLHLESTDGDRVLLHLESTDGDLITLDEGSETQSEWEVFSAHDPSLVPLSGIVVICGAFLGTHVLDTAINLKVAREDVCVVIALHACVEKIAETPNLPGLPTTDPAFADPRKFEVSPLFFAHACRKFDIKLCDYSQLSGLKLLALRIEPLSSVRDSSTVVH